MTKELILFFCCFFLSLSSTAEGLGPFSGRVQVDVTARETIKGQIESYLTRELRSLGDVVVTDESPEWQLLVIAVETTSAGRVNGVALSVVVLKPLDNTFILDATREEAKELVTVITSSALVDYNGNSLRVGPLNGLRSMCDKIIVEFDTNELKPARKLWQSMIESEKLLKEQRLMKK